MERFFITASVQVIVIASVLKDKKGIFAGEALGHKRTSQRDLGVLVTQPAAGPQTTKPSGGQTLEIRRGYVDTFEEENQD